MHPSNISTSETVTVEPIAATQDAAAVPASPTDGIVQLLCSFLQAGSAVAVGWRDWALGTEISSSSGSRDLRRRVDQALSDSQAIGEIFEASLAPDVSFNPPTRTC